MAPIMPPAGPPPLPSWFAVFEVVSIVSAFVPVAAAWRKRQLTWKTPVGQVALLWLAMSILGLLGATRRLYHVPPRDFPLSAVAIALFPIMLLPPTLTWIGSRAARWRWPAVAAWSVIAAALVGLFGVGRPLMTAGMPIMGFGMCILTALALGARIQRSDPETMRNEPWFWILVAHLMYFAASAIRGPFTEALVLYDWNAVLYVTVGLYIIFVIVYVLLARGFLLADAPGAAPPSAPAAWPPEPPSSVGRTAA